MALTLLKIKVFPTSSNINLSKLKEEIETNIKKHKGKVEKYEEEPIAFGLKALIVTISWPEEQDTNIVEEEIKKVKNVSSVDIIDYRRAFG